MFHSVAKDPQEWVNNVNNALRESLNPQDRLLIPAGNSPVQIYKDWESNRYEFLESLKLIQIDEILDGALRFRNFFHQHLPSYIDQFEWIDENAYSADVALLGLGLNGHVGFHEPGIPKHFYHGKVRLQESTVKSLSVEEGTLGLTYGLEAFMNCKRVILILSSKGKEKILNEVFQKNDQIPASHLMEHPDFHIIELKSST
jgi:6-phosphogluconolactonase/glucosamine-6-phosphate isomerase/deaminase